jgi:beta-lactamase superfamily II metal-dependent hydrolase
MKITVFQAGKGDCLLLEGAGGEHILVDGGLSGPYKEHVAPALGALRERGVALDLVYVSHIDEDHIEGLLALMRAEVEWRVHDHQVATGNAAHRPPKVPRPPEVKELWHNAFHDQVPLNAGPVTDMLAATAAVLDAGDDPADPRRAQRQRDLATSVDQGIQLSSRAGAKQLDIPLNSAFEGKLALVREGQKPIELGGLKLTVIGPFEEDLKILRKEWNAWLDDNQKQLEATRARMQADAERLGAGEVELARVALALAGAELGDRGQVTAPNLASLMLLVEEGAKTVLLTGDGHANEVIRGLEHEGRLDANGAFHADVLKVQHHGAEFNITEDFCRRVTADRYIFCANGAHENPDLRALQAILDARLAQPGDPFELLFNGSSKSTGNSADPDHMRKVEKLVADAAKAHPDRVSASFLEDHFFEVEL